jgi:hypothetical protein
MLVRESMTPNPINVHLAGDAPGFRTLIVTRLQP